jgi:hypothetical protein
VDDGCAVTAKENTLQRAVAPVAEHDHVVSFVGGDSGDSRARSSDLDTLVSLEAGLSQARACLRQDVLLDGSQRLFQTCIRQKARGPRLTTAPVCPGRT